MFKDTSFIVSFIFIVIFNSSYSNDTSLNILCALRHTLCNLDLPRPCCNPKDQCQQTWPDNLFRCIEDIILSGLGKSCELDEDCDEIKHAKCSRDGKCICRMKTVKVDPWTCGPILGGFCWNDEPCAADNAVCIKNECKCIKGYSLRHNNKCVRDILDTYCENDDVCNQVKFAKCSEDKICSCTANTTAVNPTYCAPIFGGFCWKTEECMIPNSICLDNKCQCNEICNSYDLEIGCVCVCKNGNCANGTIPSVRISNAICTGVNECVCFKKYPFEETHACTLTDKVNCVANNLCAVENSVCIDNFCQCKPKFRYHSHQCVPPRLGIQCKNNSDCKEILNSMCSENGICMCKINYGEYNITACAPLLGKSCFKNQICAPLHSRCKNNRCTCDYGFLQYSEDKCLPHYIRMHCEDNNDCRYIVNSYCRSDINICTCKIGHGMVNQTTCAPLLEKFCLENQLCAPLHSSCKNDKCICDDGFLRYSEDKCLPHYIRMPCEDNNDCRYILNSYCRNDINICICKSTHRMRNETSCAPMLGERCKPNEQCAVPDSRCIDNTCQCQLGYQNYDGNCVLIDAGLRYFLVPCTRDDDCYDVKYSVCSYDNHCRCKPNYTPLGHNKCLGSILEYCDYDDECFSYSTVCVNNKCQCSEKFYASNKTHCDSKHLGITCKENHDCSVAIKNSECSTDKICVCKKNYYSLNEFECLPALFGDCSNNDDCLIKSSICIDEQCQCKKNFSPISETQCIQNELLYSCNEVSECGDPWHYICEKDRKCRCNRNNISINRSTCSPSLKGYCWNDRQCTTSNSSCVDYHCQCNHQFSAVSHNLCLPKSNSID